MTKNPIRLAVVGLGMASKPHLEALRELKGKVEVSGMYNRSRDRADVASTTFGFPLFDSVQAIAQDKDTDAVILITPPNQRIELVRQLASAGKHILTEKPVERTLDAAREIVELCDTNAVKLGVMFQHRFRAAAQRLAQAVQQGELGDIAVVRAQIPWWRPQSYYDVSGRGSYDRDGGGVLISQAIHVLDFMLSVTGPVASVQALAATTRMHRMESEDFVAGGIEFASGAVGSIVATTATFPGDIESLVIDGTKASATLVGGRLDIHHRSGKTESIGDVSGTGGGADPMAFPCDWHRDLIEDFANSISHDHEPLVTGKKALHVHELIEALVASSREGRRIQLTELGDCL